MNCCWCHHLTCFLNVSMNLIFVFKKFWQRGQTWRKWQGWTKPKFQCLWHSAPKAHTLNVKGGFLQSCVNTPNTVFQMNCVSGPSWTTIIQTVPRKHVAILLSNGATWVLSNHLKNLQGRQLSENNKCPQATKHCCFSVSVTTSAGVFFTFAVRDTNEMSVARACSSWLC